MNLKIYGERNTGTNYIEKLILSNTNMFKLRGTVPKNIGKVFLKMDMLHFLHPISEFLRDLYFAKSFCSNLGWKHMEVDYKSLSDCSNFNDTVFVCVVKNPYSWSLSLYDKPYHTYEYKNSFDTFLKMKWRTVGREHANKKYYSNVIDMWNKKVNSYFELNNNYDKVIIIKYEDILNSPNLIYTHLKNFNVELSSSLTNIEESTKENEKNNTYYKDYYLNEKWKEKLSVESIETINNDLNFELLEKLGYEKL